MTFATAEPRNQRNRIEKNRVDVCTTSKNETEKTITVIITSLRLNAIEAVTSDVMKAQGKSRHFVVVFVSVSETKTNLCREI